MSKEQIENMFPDCLIEYTDNHKAFVHCNGAHPLIFDVANDYEFTEDGRIY